MAPLYLYVCKRYHPPTVSVISRMCAVAALIPLLYLASNGNVTCWILASCVEGMLGAGESIIEHTVMGWCIDYEEMRSGPHGPVARGR